MPVKTDTKPRMSRTAGTSLVVFAFLAIGSCAIALGAGKDVAGADTKALDKQIERATVEELQRLRTELAATRVALDAEKKAHEGDNAKHDQALKQKDTDKANALKDLNDKWVASKVTLTLYDDADYKGESWVVQWGINGGDVKNFQDWKGSNKHDAGDRTSSAKVSIEHP
jgi:hypothetical protein